MPPAVEMPEVTRKNADLTAMEEAGEEEEEVGDGGILEESLTLRFFCSSVLTSIAVLIKKQCFFLLFFIYRSHTFRSKFMSRSVESAMEIK